MRNSLPVCVAKCYACLASACPMSTPKRSFVCFCGPSTCLSPVPSSCVVQKLKDPASFATFTTHLTVFISLSPHSSKSTTKMSSCGIREDAVITVCVVRSAHEHRSFGRNDRLQSSSSADNAYASNTHKTLRNAATQIHLLYFHSDGPTDHIACTTTTHSLADVANECVANSYI